MKAAAPAQRILLDLQAVDTAINQLDHRRNTLPETATARALQAERGRATERVVEAETVASDLANEQAKAEADLVPVRERLARNRTRVDDGSVGDPKALQGLVDEIAHLTTRITTLEDAELDVMERLEQARADVEEATRVKGEVEDRLRGVLKQREALLTEIAQQRGEHETERAMLASTVPADLLALYARVAEKAGGVGAALLQHGRCGGCQLEATSADLNRYRAAAPDEVLRCEECNRILVRTDESGL